MVNIINFGWHRTIATFLLVIAYDHLHEVYGMAATTTTTTTNQRHQINENLKFLSQNSNANINGLQPSRLRTLLINDLRNILVKNVCINKIYYTR